MSPVIYFIADLYPWWGIPLAFILAELANYYRRHGDKKKMLIFLAASGVLMLLACLYFVFNGMEHLRPAMQQMEKDWSNK